MQERAKEQWHFQQLYKSFNIYRWYNNKINNKNEVSTTNCIDITKLTASLASPPSPPPKKKTKNPAWVPGQSEWA